MTEGLGPGAFEFLLLRSGGVDALVGLLAARRIRFGELLRRLSSCGGDGGSVTVNTLGMIGSAD